MKGFETNRSLKLSLICLIFLFGVAPIIAPLPQQYQFPPQPQPPQYQNQCVCPPPQPCPLPQQLPQYNPQQRGGDVVAPQLPMQPQPQPPFMPQPFPPQPRPPIIPTGYDPAADDIFAGVPQGQPQKEVPKATATIRSPIGVQGVLTFSQLPNGATRITGQITKLPSGPHGFHIHEKGDLRNLCGSAGGHFNPESKNHGAPTDAVRHAGDLGNIIADENGIANVDITDQIIKFEGPFSIIRRAVVIHENADDLGKGGDDESLRTGKAGKRIACAIIKEA